MSKELGQGIQTNWNYIRSKSLQNVLFSDDQGNFTQDNDHPTYIKWNQ